MIYALLKAIQDHFNDSILPPFLGGVFVGLAPQGTDGDYATLNIVSTAPGYAMNDTQVWQDTKMQVSLWTWDTTPAGILQTAELWANTFDDAALTVTGGVCVWMRRAAGPLPLADPDGGWQVTIDYDISIDEV